MKNTYQLILLLVCITFIQCTTETLPSILKHRSSDPFVTTMTQSQIFEINPNKNNTIEGKEGTIIVFPQACFIDAQGQIIKKNIQIELVESLSIEEMLLSNLMTVSNGKPLETDGMIYLNATNKGKQLNINPEKPIYIEIPSHHKKPSMLVYKGKRDDHGKMNWTEPQKLEDFIIPVNIHSLDFLPNGFEEEVAKGMPYKNYDIVTKELVDSLYYSFAPFFEENMNDSLFKKETSHKHGGYSHSHEGHEEHDHDGYLVKGINPAIIKTIKDDKFQNTLLATREFETRLQAIFNLCDNKAIEIYINNLDKDLWELDSMVSDVFDSDIFRNFSNEKKTHIEEENIYIETLQAYYQERLKTIQSKLEGVYKKQQTERKRQDKIAEETKKEYQQLLEKRNGYRKETYGFMRTDLGWINIDKGTAPKDWQPEELEILVHDGASFDRVYSYLIYTSIKSLYQLKTSDNITFKTGDKNSNTANMPKNKMAVSVSIAYKNEITYLAIKEFKIGIEKQFSLDLEVSSMKDIKKALKVYDNYSAENKIDKDLAFLEILAKEEKRRGEIEKEEFFIIKLALKIYPCFVIEYPSEADGN